MKTYCRKNGNFSGIWSIPMWRENFSLSVWCHLWNKKPRLKKVHLSPPLLKKNYNLPFQIASVYQYVYVPYLQNVHLMLQIFDKKMNNLSEYKNVYYINRQQNWVYLYWIHFRIVSSFFYIFYFLSDFCYIEKNMLTLYKVILENSFRDA